MKTHRVFNRPSPFFNILPSDREPDWPITWHRCVIWDNGLTSLSVPSRGGWTSEIERAGWCATNPLDSWLIKRYERHKVIRWCISSFSFQPPFAICLPFLWCRVHLSFSQPISRYLVVDPLDVRAMQVSKLAWEKENRNDEIARERKREWEVGLKG